MKYLDKFNSKVLIWFCVVFAVIWTIWWSIDDGYFNWTPIALSGGFFLFVWIIAYIKRNTL